MRKSGVLLHITSLPGPYGVGTMGRQAYSFVDFLENAGQGYWQILPLTPTGFGNSPYQSCCSQAGNPYLIDLDLLIEEGLLKKEQVQSVRWCESPDRVDFGLMYQNRLPVLRLAYHSFSGGEEFDRFCRENGSWLPDYALFMALKDATGGKPWYEWDDGLKFRQADAIWNARKRYAQEIRFYSFVQFAFFRQWDLLHGYAKDKGVEIIGDVPIYVPYDSCDVWRSPELFQLDEELMPTAVAGCPPDYFTQDGQLWGNPLYRWDKMQRDNFSWWISRLQAAGKLYDVIRIDHFRGLESYWSVPAGDTTARNGSWIKGPGLKFIQAVKAQLPQIRLIAEDLGFLTPEVLNMRDESGFPGMKVLEFAFDSKGDSDYLPHKYIPNSVCYTGTHDNMTLRQWLESAKAETLDYAKAYMHLTEQEGFVWGAIRTAMASVSDLCVIPMQDLLDLGEEARMNFPGTMSDRNWSWRLGPDEIEPSLARRLLSLTELYGRKET